MAEIVERQGVRTRTRTTATTYAADPRRQAFRILHLGFIVAPTVAGIDKFFHLLTNWDKYLAPAIARMLPVSPHTFMLAVGVIEIAAGLLVALKPKIGAYVVAAWLGGIVLNLLISGSYFDIALRDFGLMLGALALGRLATSYDRREVVHVDELPRV
jgi:hypothetical protein